MHRGFTITDLKIIKSCFTFFCVSLASHFKPTFLIYAVCVVYVPTLRLTNTQESLESSLLDKENTLAKTSEKLELISSLGESLSQKELQLREISEKLLQTELSVSNALPPHRRCFRHATFFIVLLCPPGSWRRSPRKAAAQRNSVRSLEPRWPISRTS